MIEARATQRTCPSIYITLRSLGCVRTDSRKWSVIPWNRSVRRGSTDEIRLGRFSVVIVSAVYPAILRLCVRLRFLARAEKGA